VGFGGKEYGKKLEGSLSFCRRIGKLEGRVGITGKIWGGLAKEPNYRVKKNKRREKRMRMKDRFSAT